MKSITPTVTLLSTTPDPVRALYQAYRVCYSNETPTNTYQKVVNGDILYTPEKMLKFVLNRMETGHVSPLEQVNFEFGVSGVSRAFSHQFVRHRVGMSVEQQSQRYVGETLDSFEVVVPPTVKNCPLPGSEAIFSQTVDLALFNYLGLLNLGIPPEDARFLLPNAAATNLKVTINLAALIHMSDLRLCTRAQWEFRKVVAMMRAEVVKQLPWLKPHIQPKCGESRLGFCDESLKDYKACPLSAVRPHKSTTSSHGEIDERYQALIMNHIG